MAPSILRLMIAAALAGTLGLCSLAIERMTGDKKTAALREHAQKRRIREAHYCRPRGISGPVGQSVLEPGKSTVGSLLESPPADAPAEAAGNPATNFDLRHPIAGRRDLASPVKQQHHADCCRTACRL